MLIQPLNIISYQQNRPLFKKHENISFKAKPPKLTGAITDAIAHTEGWLASTKPMQKLVDFLKDKNYQQHIVAAVGLVLSSFYMLDTAKSKDIEKDHKLSLILNQGIVALASTVGGYTLDNWLSKKLSAFTETFNIANIKNASVRNEILKMHEKKNNLQKSDFNTLFKLITNKEENKSFSYEKDILETFDFTPALKKQLKSFFKKNPDDKIAKQMLEELGKINPKDRQKIVKENKIFFDFLDKSPFLKKAFSKQSFEKALKYVTNNQKGLSQLMEGLKIAKSLMVFGLIYRFVSPVIATPLANAASDRVEKRKTRQRQA